MINWCDFFLGAGALLIFIILYFCAVRRHESNALLEGEMRALSRKVDSLDRDIYIYKIEFATLRAEYNLTKEKIDGKNG